MLDYVVIHFRKKFLNVEKSRKRNVVFLPPQDSVGNCVCTVVNLHIVKLTDILRFQTEILKA